MAAAKRFSSAGKHVDERRLVEQGNAANLTRMLLLDFDAESGAGVHLLNILNSSSRPDAEIQVERLSGFRISEGEGRYARFAARCPPEVVLLTLPVELLEPSGALLRAIRRETPRTAAVVVTASGKPDEIFTLLQLGADDFIAPPLTAAGVLPRLWRLLAQQRSEPELVRRLREKVGLEQQIIGTSSTLLAVLRTIPRVARTDATVLISGETGTGKELCARAIHYLSPRLDHPMVPVNCGAIPPELMENELFGHQSGAFTSAAASQTGVIQEADGGTLFLDEIDCLPLLSQVKLLRFLQDKQYRPLGSPRLRHADVRLVAATNHDLAAAVELGAFRQDLYFRLNVVPLSLPPLRERTEDIPVLARHFLATYCVEYHKQATFAPGAIEKLAAYSWPGNVRELENLVQRLLVLCDPGEIRPCDISLPEAAPIAREAPFQEMKARSIKQFERGYLEHLLNVYHGNISRAAEAAQKNRRAFWELIRKHHIDATSFRTSSEVHAIGQTAAAGRTK